MKLDLSVSEMIIYPIKSLPGIKVNQSQVTPFGLLDDRCIMLVDDNGLFITQRKYPELALIEIDFKGIDSKEKGLTVVAKKNSVLELSKESFTKNKIPVRIWKDDCVAYVAKKEINQWFSEFLSVSVRLVQYDQRSPRASDPRYSSTEDVVSFADGFPLLVITESSLFDLNSKLKKTVTMANFRPNLVVAGAEAYAEDYWKKIRIGSVVFDAVKRCSRCILTTVDPKNGIKDDLREPLNTLEKYRRFEEGVLFGMNLIPRTGGMVNINQKIEIISRLKA